MSVFLSDLTAKTIIGDTDIMHIRSAAGDDFNITGANVLRNLNHDFAMNSALIGTTTGYPAISSAPLQVLGDFTLVGRDVETDNAEKTLNIGLTHYDRDEEPMMIIRGVSQVSANILQIGGGWNQANAATEIRFYLGTSNTTLVGNEAARFDLNASNLPWLGIGVTTPLFSSIESLGFNGDFGINDSGGTADRVMYLGFQVELRFGVTAGVDLQILADLELIKGGGFRRVRFNNVLVGGKFAELIWFSSTDDFEITRNLLRPYTFYQSQAARQDNIFTAIVPYLPNIGDIVKVTGGFADNPNTNFSINWNCSYAERISATEVRFYGIGLWYNVGNLFNDGGATTEYIRAASTITTAPVQVGGNGNAQAYDFADICWG